ncbi:MAG: sulfatase, partial [Gemmatimonadota bacterium]|nr:sulfatase [Gemmatimonadota bacterium]
MKPIDRRRFLGMAGKSALGLACGDLALSSARACAETGKDTKLNFVFILIDDMGWADSACYGSTFYQTPNLDKLASQGMRFTDAYAAAPVCSPTRASVMTGKYPARLHLTNFLVGRFVPENSRILPPDYRLELPLEEVTIPEALKPAGYVSAHIGKWHLGDEPYYPQHQGFDLNVGGSHIGMPRDFFYPEWGDKPPIDGRHGEYLTDRLTEEAENFIEKNRDKPFFLHLAHYAVHVPIQAKKDIIKKYQSRLKPGNVHDNTVYAAMIESVDESVGRVMKKLEDLGIADRTVVIFTSDNGGLSVKEGDFKHTPATSNAPLRAGKGYLYEGGIREPMIVRWPTEIEPGSVCDVAVTSVDFFPTILEMAGIEPDPGNPVDGVSLVPLLNQTGPLDREAIFWHYPHFSNQ